MNSDIILYMENADKLNKRVNAIKDRELGKSVITALDKAFQNSGGSKDDSYNWEAKVQQPFESVYRILIEYGIDIS